MRQLGGADGGDYSLGGTAPEPPRPPVPSGPPEPEGPPTDPQIPDPREPWWQ